MSNPSIPITYELLKSNLRDGLVSNERREYWWPVLSNIDENQAITHHNDMKQAASNLFSMMQQYINPFDSILIGNILLKQNKIDDLRIVEDLIAIIESVMNNHELTFLILTDLLSHSNKYLCESRDKLRQRVYTFKNILSVYMPKTFTVLNSILALEDDFLVSIFTSFFTRMLPNDVVLRIIDSYLLEGIKIIYRYGLALFRLHKRKIKSKVFTSGNNFWNFIETVLISDEDKKKLHQYAFDSDRFVISKILHPMKISRKYIYETEGKALTQSSVVNTDSNSINELHKANVFDTVLSSESCNYLLTHLPDFAKFITFELVYSSTTHGYSLHKFYRLTSNRKPSIIFIKCPSANVIIGAYINDTITTVYNSGGGKIKGDGTTVIFKLNNDNSEENICYNWIGSQAVNNEYSNVTDNQFAIFSNDYFCIGGSVQHGSNAIRVDSDLNMCTCGYSDTFNNPPLFNFGEPFQIQSIEVYSGM